MILSAYEPISLYRPDEKPPLIHKADTKEKPDDKPNAGEDGDKPIIHRGLRFLFIFERRKLQC